MVRSHETERILDYSPSGSQVFYSQNTGDINYYKKEGDKAGYNDLICSVDKTGNISSEISQAGLDATNLSNDELLKIQNSITNYVSSYSNMQFYNVYSFKENVNAQIQENLYINALNDLSDQTDSAVSQNTFSFERTSVDGILALYTDGYEDVTADSFTADMYNPASIRDESEGQYADHIGTGYCTRSLPVRTGRSWFRLRMRK